MRWIRLGSATLNQTALDWRGNLARAVGAVEMARERGVQLLVLPEMALCGYGCEDAYHSLAHSERAMAQLLDFAATTKGLAVVVGLPVRLQHGLYNAAAFVVDGRVAAFAGKQSLAGDGVHYEPRWFRPWTAGRVTEADVDGRPVPFGDLLLDLGGVRVGAEICEDAWGPDRPGARLAKAGADIIANPTASHFAFAKWRTRERLVEESSRAFACTYIYSNPVGNDSGRIVYDGDRLIATGGAIVARGARFTFRDFDVTDAVVDIDLDRMRRARTASFRPSDAGAHIVSAPVEWTLASTPPAQPLGPPRDWNGGPHEKEEEFARAVALGLHDYLRKSRSRGFVVSLSGGADSATVAAMAALAIELPRAELGDAEVAQRLPGVDLDPDSRCGGILSTVYQGSENSSETTRAAAESVAREVGSLHSEWRIDEFVAGYRARVEEALGRPLDWQQDDIALQNIQARVRAPGVWMIANVRNALLLSTSNRSEAAVGYATMDGDTCGSLSPIAGIDKKYLREWLRWMAADGPAAIRPMPGLLAVCDIPPTAELRPSESKQTDEDDLMPYALLDAIERLAVRDRLSPAQIRDRLAPEWAGEVGGAEALAAHIAKFFRLFCRNQWKRERYAPSFHLDDANLDPKTWCRFPILSGGYEAELDELRGG